MKLMFHHIVVKKISFKIFLLKIWKFFVEFLDGFRTNSTFQQQDRNELTNLASSLTSFFDYTGITDLAQTRIASKIEIYFFDFSSVLFIDEISISNRLPVVSNRTTSRLVHNVIFPLFFYFILSLNLSFYSLLIFQLKSKKNYLLIMIW